MSRRGSAERSGSSSLLLVSQERIGANICGGGSTIGPWQLHPLVLLFALSGTLMISKTLRISRLWRHAAGARRAVHHHCDGTPG